jgi:hypothetical protein
MRWTAVFFTAGAVLLGAWAASIAAAGVPPAPPADMMVDWEKPPLRTFYADPAGTGAGRNRASPRALDELLPTIEPGDRVILLPGTYPSTRITLKGSAERPIWLEAEHPAVGPGLTTETIGRALFQNSGLDVTESAYLHIEGLAFEVEENRFSNGITVTKSHHLALRRNYFFQQTNTGLLLASRVGQVLVEDNVFRNMLVGREAGGIGGIRTDYGLRVHRTRDLVVRGNLFDGYFNHSLSLKEKIRDVRIEDNLFRICGYVCIEGGQEPDSAHGGTRTDRTIADVTIANNRFDGLDDGTVGVFARNAERIFVTANRFAGIGEPLRIANNDRNSRSCERQLQVLGRALRTCERGSRLTLAGRPNLEVRFDGNMIIGDARMNIAGRGYASDFLFIENSLNTGRVEICRRPFIRNDADVNAWTDGLPAFPDPPEIFRDASQGFTVREGTCTGTDLTSDCTAEGNCTGSKD